MEEFRTTILRSLQCNKIRSMVSRTTKSMLKPTTKSEHMKNTAWELDILSSWLKALDYSGWQKYHKSYHGLKGELKRFIQAL
jgi:hypothetical protein